MNTKLALRARTQHQRSNNTGTALHIVAQFGYVDVAKVLIRNGADVNAVDEDNWTALHFTAYNGHVDVAQVLLQNGTDVDAVTNMKSTPLRMSERTCWRCESVASERCRYKCY